MSSKSRNKIFAKPPNIEITPDVNLHQVPETSAENISSAFAKNLNLKKEDEDNGLLHTKPNSTQNKTISHQDHSAHSHQMIDSQQSPGTQLLTDPPREDGMIPSDYKLQEEESPVLQHRPLGENKRIPKLEFRRQDSIPVVVNDFNQIESNFFEEKNGFRHDDDSLSVNSPEKVVSGTTTKSTFAQSKFAPDHMKKNNSQSTFGFRSPQNRNTIHNPSGLSLSQRGDEKDARKMWNKLSYIFQSVMLFNREEVKNINTPADIFDEIASFQVRQWRNKPHQKWDISKQDFAREAFQTIRKVQIFCECAAIGSRKHVNFMREMIIQDPKRYLVEPDDPTFIINHPNNLGQTPLYIASKNGNLGVVQLLLEYKANPLQLSKVSPGNKDIELPLEVAVKWRHESIVEFFLAERNYERRILKKCQGNSPSLNMRNIFKREMLKNDKKKGWRIKVIS